MKITKATVLALVTTILVPSILAGCGRGPVGATGAQGVQGEAGAAGSDGQGCTVTPIDVSPEYPNGGALVSCGESQVAVTNGADGAQGPAGAYAVASLLDPCGPQGSHDEVLVRLANGKILASFSDNVQGKNTRLSIINPGSYMTTDGTNCYFTINNDGSISY